MLAKTLAEEKAWKFAKEDRTDLVTINPGLVLGPFFQPKLIFSVEVLIQKLIHGNNSATTQDYKKSICNF